MPGEFKIDKIMGLYERDNEQEKVKIPGPIPFELVLQVRWWKNDEIPLSFNSNFDNILNLGFSTRQK